ncbi:MAG: hypothetical protein HWN51_01575, partial [Desulfobacterales bacterium]|nr:hypothetical protein [Desulfobacterales bacterium]
KGMGEPLAPLQGRVLSLDEEAWIALASGEEHLVRLDLAELFDLDRQTGYVAEFEVKRFGKSTLVLPATESPQPSLANSVVIARSWPTAVIARPDKGLFYLKI